MAWQNLPDRRLANRGKVCREPQPIRHWFLQEAAEVTEKYLSAERADKRGWDACGSATIGETRGKVRGRVDE